LKKRFIKSIVSSVNLSSQQIINLAKIYIPACLFIFLLWLLTQNTQISIYELVADPTEVGKLAPYTGLVSTLGVLFWCGAGSICFFSAYLLKLSQKSNSKWSFFFLVSAYFILLFLIDDLFQLHENFSTLIFGVEANIAQTNRPLQHLLETIVFVIYGSLFTLYIFYFRKLIYQTNLLVLILALLFFTISLVIDVLFEGMKGDYILEEGFKLLGIISILTYYIKSCYQKIKQLFEDLQQFSVE
jgi:hypothetical protein